MTEREEEQYLEEEGTEMEGWEDRVKDFVLTMQQYSTWYSYGIKHGSHIRLQVCVCVCVRVCVVSTNSALDLWRGGDGVLRVGCAQIV